MQTLLNLAIIFCLLACTACSRAAPDAQSSTAPVHQPGSPAAIAALAVAQQTGGKPGDVVIYSTEAVSFGDSSLGCPEPGMAYLQVITPGYKVIAEAAGKTYDVRVAGEHGKICDSRAPEDPAGR